MKTFDKYYLSLQFQNKIFSKNGTEFQSFFEDVMEKAFLDFQKIRPEGNKGDGGNDGYREALGVYYQVYAPQTPKVNEREAAKKFENDFKKLKTNWDQISKITEYNFVFNDKYGGSTQSLEEVKAKLKANNPGIEFKLFLAKDLEKIFFQLDQSKILSLGFNIDQRQAIANAYTFLDNIKAEFDRENIIFAQKLLEGVKEILAALGDEALLLEYEILECKCLQKFERVEEAKKKYEGLSVKYPDDPRPPLLLAEIYLNDRNFKKNSELLEKAEKINSEFWLLKLEKVLRQAHLRENIEPMEVDEKDFPDDLNAKASLYRIYSLIFEDLGDSGKADSFVEKAIALKPDRFSNYVAKLALLETRLLLSQNEQQRVQISQILLDEIEKVENAFRQYGDIGARNNAILLSKKLIALLAQDNISKFEDLSKEIFELLLVCYFDRQIDGFLTRVLQYVLLPNSDLARLLDYLRNSQNEISEDLSRMLIDQFNLKNTLVTDGKKFFHEIGSQMFFEFICDVENRNDEKILSFLKENIGFAISFANTSKRLPDLRKKIIESLPDDGRIQKEKLRLLLNFDEKEYDEAFEILRRLDLSTLNYSECKPLLYIAQQKGAWDFEIIILEKLIEKEKQKKDLFYLRIQLLNAYLNSEKYPDAINIGERLLQEDAAENFYNPRRQDVLLSNTIYACLQRGKVDSTAFARAKSIIGSYQLINPTFEFKTGIEAELYISNNEAVNALRSIIDGIKIKKTLSSQEYAKLYFHFVRIGNLIEDLNPDSLPVVQENTFVKLSGKDRWYFIGNKHELDASLVTRENNKYSILINKTLGDEIVFDNKYTSESYRGEIELVFTLEKYVLWQVIKNFQELARVGDLEGVVMIEIPQNGDSIDINNLMNLFGDINARKEPFFDMYCNNNYPLALLAISEGGLVGAIGRIQNENKGFIHFSTGATNELEQQKELAKKIIDDKLPFYIDGTSALMLSETGLLPKIYPLLPNLHVPQSVISLLAEINNRFRYIPGQTGENMGYAKGKITISTIDQDKRDLILNNFRASINLFESNPKNIGVISSANKTNTFSETRVPDELSDACILAQKENLPVLTEDHLYLAFNELETKKKAPQYFSSWALMRVLYDEGYITFDEYLDYFGYLSSYRFRFLPLTTDDIEKAVFGDKKFKFVKPENIRMLNFPLTLSEEYGVPFQVALQVVGSFLHRVVLDDVVALDVVEKIFAEITSSFPTKRSKSELGQLLLEGFRKALDGNMPIKFYKFQDKLRYQKIDKLLEMTQSYDVET